MYLYIFFQFLALISVSIVCKNAIHMFMCHQSPCVYSLTAMYTTSMIAVCVCMYMWCIIFHTNRFSFKSLCNPSLCHVVWLLHIFSHLSRVIFVLLFYMILYEGNANDLMLSMYETFIFKLDIISVASFKCLAPSVFDTWLSYLCWCPCNWTCQLKYSLHLMNYPVIIGKWACVYIFYR